MITEAILRLMRDHRTPEQIIKDAEDAIKTEPKEYREWLYSLFNILKDGKYATVMIHNTLMDVESFTHTFDFLSFFDVINKVHQVDLSFDPIIITELKNKIPMFND